jgi:hypothetical protein
VRVSQRPEPDAPRIDHELGAVVVADPAEERQRVGASVAQFGDKELRREAYVCVDSGGCIAVGHGGGNPTTVPQANA